MRPQLGWCKTQKTQHRRQTTVQEEEAGRQEGRHRGVAVLIAALCHRQHRHAQHRHTRQPAGGLPAERRLPLHPSPQPRPGSPPALELHVPPGVASARRHIDHGLPPPAELWRSKDGGGLRRIFIGSVSPLLKDAPRLSSPPRPTGRTRPRGRRGSPA